MSIKQLQTKLERLNARIEACQAQLDDLKAQRKDIKSRLTQAKKAAKNGAPPPASSEGLTERIASRLTETVLNPLAGMLGASPDPGKQ